MNRLHQYDVLCAWYREHMAINGYRPRSIKDYTFELRYFRRFLEECDGMQDIDDITPALLQAYATSLYDKGLASATLHHKLSALNSFFGTLYEENKIYVDLRGHLQRPKVGKKLPAGILTEEETQRILEYIERTTQKPQVLTLNDAVELRDCAIFDAFYSTGMRRNELTALTLDHIRAAEGLVHIHQGKGGKDRVVPIGAAALATVQRYIETARPFLAHGPCPYLFVTRHSQCLGSYTVRQAVIRVTQTAGITRHVKVHTLRHTCATHLLNNGADIRYVQELLGHATLSSTQIYTHVSIGKLQETHRNCHPREKGTV